MPFHIALYKPEIPPNTGNISRLCVGIKANLHIIDKPSFEISESAVRRAGLDHWHKLKLTLHETWESFFKSIEDRSRIFLVTKFAKVLYTSLEYQKGDYFVFGNETSGLPFFVHESVPDSQKIFIPMLDFSVRSLNLSNSVAIISYEAIRQLHLKGEISVDPFER